MQWRCEHDRIHRRQVGADDTRRQHGVDDLQCDDKHPGRIPHRHDRLHQRHSQAPVRPQSVRGLSGLRARGDADPRARTCALARPGGRLRRRPTTQSVGCRPVARTGHRRGRGIALHTRRRRLVGHRTHEGATELDQHRPHHQCDHQPRYDAPGSDRLHTEVGERLYRFTHCASRSGRVRRIRQGHRGASTWGASRFGK